MSQIFQTRGAFVGRGARTRESVVMKLTQGNDDVYTHVSATLRTALSVNGP